MSKLVSCAVVKVLVSIHLISYVVPSCHTCLLDSKLWEIIPLTWAAGDELAHRDREIFMFLSLCHH